MSDNRSEYVAGLRALADLLEQHDELPLPYTGTTSGLHWVEFDREVVARIIRALPGPVAKDYLTDNFKASAMIHGLSVGVISNRATVCERVVLGTEQVTVPAVEAQPEQVVEREVVEWRCEPVLSEVSA